MRERPILMSAPMVRAILAGTKTQTRRAWREQPPPGVRVGYVPGETRTPYGQPGDRLWVREAWRAPASCNHLPPRSIYDTEPVRFVADETFGADAGFGKLRQSMFMPRWASRITLEITGVRVERLQDISEADAIAEGIELMPGPETYPMWKHYGRADTRISCPVESYRSLWEQINGPGSWDANPWVWVVEFRRLAC